jgi:hypothetical protein
MKNSVLLQLKKPIKEIQGFSSNPINSSSMNNEVFNRMTNSMIKIVSLLDNPRVNKIVKDEFGKDYPTVSAIVKERLFVVGS